MNHSTESENTNFNLPPILYKYRIWSDIMHQKIQKNQLYLAPFSSFNSRYEHNLETDYSHITDEALWQYFYDTMESQCGITEHFKKVEHSNYMLEHTPFRDILHRKKIEKTYFKKLDCNRGIISFSDANDNLLLWDRFAKYNTGFVIGFDSNFIIQENIPIGMFSKINYYNIDFPPKIHALRSFFNPDSMEDYGALINSLPDIYKDENEYRFSKVIRHKQRIFFMHKKYFKEVIIGSNMPLNERNEIIEIVKRRFPNCKLKEQVLDHDFMIYRELPIN